MNQQPKSDHSSSTEDTPTPPFVLNEFFERCMGNAAVATLLLDKFEQQLTTDVQQIQERLAVQDAEQIARTAHSLKGAAGALAATALCDCAAQIETLSRANQLDSVVRELASLESEVARCLAYLPTARAGIASGDAGGSAESGAP